MRWQWYRRLAAPAALLVLGSVCVSAQSGFGRTGTTSPSPGAPPAGWTTVTLGGVSLNVPASWPVVDLRTDPSACVDFDRSAVYLGHAGTNQACPARAVGDAAAVQLEPADRSVAGEVSRATAASSVHGIAVRLDPSAARDGETRLVVPGRAVLVTVTGSPTDLTVSSILGSLTVGSTPAAAAPEAPASPSASPSAGPASGATQGRGPGTYTGPGFDTCAAPPESTMTAWLASPYRSVGIYIGGINAGCKSQPNLSTQWIDDVTNQGWRLVPTYVGLQAPCDTSLGYNPIDTNLANALYQGKAAGDDARTQAVSLGLLAGSPIYDDMEGYDTKQPGCSASVLAFLNGWAEELHVDGYQAGVYGSSASTVADLVSQVGTAGYSEPDDIWFANWSCCPSSVAGDPNLPTADWSQHQRLHQYQGQHTETWGGVTLSVDSDYDDGAVVGSLPGYVLDGWGGIHPFGGAPQVFGTSYWPNQDVARGLALQTGGGGGYVVDDWGGLHPFGDAPATTGNSYWPGQDVVRAIALDPCDPTGTSGYVLDDWGGVHPFGGAPPVLDNAYWPGYDIARSLTMVCIGGQPGGQVLDGWGGLHQIGSAPNIVASSYWPGQDVAVSAVLTSTTSGYTLDDWGGIHPFGSAPPVTPSAYWPNTRTARGMAVAGSAGAGSAASGGSANASASPAGYVVDPIGGIHAFGNAAQQNLSPLYIPIARGVALFG